MSEKRWCFYIPAGDAEADTPHGWIPARVVEGEPGYALFAGNGELSSPWYWGDLRTAQRIAEERNSAMGITPEAAAEIVMSSIRAAYGLGEP